MITSLILSVFMAIINTIFQALPNASSLPSGVNNAFGSLAGWLASADAIFPVDTLLQIVGIIVLVEVSIWTVKISLRLFAMVRG